MASAAIDTNNIHKEMKELTVNDELKDNIKGESHSPDHGLGKSLPISEISTSDKNIDEPKKGKKIVVISRGVPATVKWFNGGFGFLTLEDDENAANDGEKDSKDIFFHKSSIITTSNYPFSDDYFLRDNDKVVCDVVRGRRNRVEAIALSGPGGIQIKALNRGREYRRHRFGGSRRMITNEVKAIENGGRDHEGNNRRETVGGRDRPVNSRRKTENGQDHEVKKSRGETGRKRNRGGRRTPDAEDKKEVEKSDEKNDETKNDESETVGAPTSGTSGTDVENQ